MRSPSFFGESPESIKKKISRLKLEVVVHAKKNQGGLLLLLPVWFCLRSCRVLKRHLRTLLKRKLLSVIAKKLGVSEEPARAKIRRLGLEEVEQRKNACSSSSELIMSEDLISIENALKKLVASMMALETIGLSKTEIMRLRTLIHTSGLYQHRLSAYVDYRGIEREMIDLAEKYETLVKREQDSGARPALFVKPAGSVGDAKALEEES